jgi:hypothetical protein
MQSVSTGSVAPVGNIASYYKTVINRYDFQTKRFYEIVNMYNKPIKHREFLKLSSYTVMIVFLHSRREDKTCNAKRHQEFPEFELHLLFS